MNVKEAIQEKLGLEQEILHLMRDFENRTGAKITGTTVFTSEAVGTRPGISRIEVRVELLGP